jgi:hypothetical protein
MCTFILAHPIVARIPEHPLVKLLESDSLDITYHIIYKYKSSSGDVVFFQHPTRLLHFREGVPILVDPHGLRLEYPDQYFPHSGRPAVRIGGAWCVSGPWFSREIDQCKVKCTTQDG